MTRIEGDTWGPASSVGATATMVAAARAAATRRPQPVIHDPFAESLVRAVGLDVFTQAATGELNFDDIDRGVGFPRIADTFAARARFYDDYLADATDAGLRQVVIVASGLDTRPYRLSWPAGTTVYEIDQPEVLDFKTSTLSKLGAVAPTEHRVLGIDLRDDWPAALLGAGFDRSQPTAWLAEGVLIGFLPPEAEVRLLNNAIALSAPGSRLAADYGTITGSSQEAQEQTRIMTDGWRKQGLDLDLAAMTYPGEHTDVAAHLRERGWETVTSQLFELFTAANLPELEPADRQSAASALSFVKAILSGKRESH